MADPTIDGPNC